MKKNLCILSLIFTLFLVGCDKNNDNGEKIDPSPTPDPVEPTPTPTIEDNIFSLESPGKNKDYPTSLDEFNPTLFKKETLKKDSEISLSEGANLITYSFNLNNDNKVKASVIEVNLEKANIKTNYNVNKSTIYDQLLDYEKNNESNGVSIINADFFGTRCVNAYIKDNTIIKDSHNDNGSYDYLDLNSDIPASKPMLFGISGNTAKIAPIIEEGTIEETIKSKFSYMLTFINKENKEESIYENVYKNLSSISDNTNYVIVDNDMGVLIPTSYNIYKFQKIESKTDLVNGKLISATKQKLEGNKSFKDTSEYFYILSKDELNIDLDSKLLYSVHNSDSSWDYYSSIIGGRQALVINGNIADTITKENTNGAQKEDVPRSAIGVVDSTNIKIVAIEALRYGKKSSSDEDSYGVNLPELAEFIRYIGCYDAMNFDGGGSTSLIVKENSEYKVKVRSSDYGTYNLEDSRKVFNSLIVISK